MSPIEIARDDGSGARAEMAAPEIPFELGLGGVLFLLCLPITIVAGCIGYCYYATTIKPCAAARPPAGGGGAPGRKPPAVPAGRKDR